MGGVGPGAGEVGGGGGGELRPGVGLRGFERALDTGQRTSRHGRQLPGQVLQSSLEVRPRDELLEKPDPLGFRGVQLTAGREQKQGLAPTDKDKITQDLRLAFPVGTAGKFRVGARRQWEGLSDQKQWSDTTQLYLGLELVR